MRPKCNAWEVAARMGRRKKKGAGDKAGGVAKPASAAAVEFAARARGIRLQAPIARTWPPARALPAKDFGLKP